MIELYKKRGETPLQALNRLRVENPELKEETLSYAGRLDPMAEGILPVLIGEEENKNRANFLQKDKEYCAHFLLGCSSDTGDILGILKDCNFFHIEKEKIINACKSLTEVTFQMYPWYSSKPVDGIPLFEHARAGRFDIVRPSKNVLIYSVTDVQIATVNIEELIKQNIQDIQGVTGDFRQEEIVKRWEEVLKSVGRPKAAQQAQVISFLIQVSSGTYIRGLSENISHMLGIPALLHKLIRTKVM